MRSFGLASALPWSLVFFLGVARLASCAPVASHIVRTVGFEDVTQHHTSVLSKNAPETPSLLPIPPQVPSTPAATVPSPRPSGTRYTYAPPPTTAVIDTSEPARPFPFPFPFPFAFPGYTTKSTTTHTSTHQNSGNPISSFFRNDDPRSRAFPFSYLFHIQPHRKSASSPSLSSTSSPALDATVEATTQGGLVLANKQSQLPLHDSRQMNVNPDAQADSSHAAPIARLIGSV